MVPQLRYARTADDVTIAYVVDGQRAPTLVWLPPAPFSDVLAQYSIPLLRAGECVVRWNGRDWRAVEPQIVDKAAGARAFGPVPRLALRVIPIDRFLRLRRT